MLDAPLLAKEVEEATASLELAQAQVEEALSIVKAEAPAPGQARVGNPHKARASLSAARAKARLARALLDRARIQASFTQLKAAFDGVVTRRTADPGNFVQPSDSRLLQPLLTVQRVDILRVVVGVSEMDAPPIKRELPVRIDIRAYRGEYKISRLSPSLDGNNRKMTVEIDVPNADNRLLSGMAITVGMPFQKTSPDNLIVPSACTFPRLLDDQGQAVYVYIVRDGKAHRKRVELRFDDGQSAEIARDILASDPVIINPEKLEDGTPVKIQETP